jgi:hypothetical protein
MIKSQQVIRDAKEHEIYKVYQQAAEDIKKLIESEPEYTQKYPVGIDRLISSEFANGGKAIDDITSELARTMQEFTSQIYCKYQDARIEEEVANGIRNVDGTLK